MRKNILVNINKGYMKHFLTMLNSLVSNNPNSRFHVYVMHTDLDENDIKRIQNCFSAVEFSYIYMDKKLFKGAPKVKRYPYEIYYRLFAPLKLPKEVDKILYLDSDLIVHGNIDELYNMEFGDKLYIACTQIRSFMQWFNRIRLTVGRKYFYINTGVMMMNIKELRQLVDMDKFFKFIKRNGWRMCLYDQDVLFKFFGNRVKLIDRYKWNVADRHIRAYNRRHRKNKIDLKWIEENNVIVHYLGTNKPWKKDYRGILKDFYYKYVIDENQIQLQDTPIKINTNLEDELKESI